MSFEDEQIVTTVPTLELASTLRNRLMKRADEGIGPRITTYVFFNSSIPNEFHLGVASEWGTKLPEDDVLEMMLNITEFQEAQINEEQEFAGEPPASVTKNTLDLTEKEQEALDFFYNVEKFDLDSKDPVHEE